MTGPLRLLLALLPLAAYFFVLGAWHAGRSAKVVSGPRDLGLLALGLGGLIAFGPVGGFVVDHVFPRASLSAWLAVASFVGLLGLFNAAGARRRIVIYQVDADILTSALGSAMEVLAGPIVRTLRGFECPEDGRGVAIEHGRWLGGAVVEVHGSGAEALADALVPSLASRLRGSARPGTAPAAFWFGMACGTAAVLAIATAFLTMPQARALIQRIGGG